MELDGRVGQNKHELIDFHEKSDPQKLGIKGLLENPKLAT